MVNILTPLRIRAHVSAVPLGLGWHSSRLLLRGVSSLAPALLGAAAAVFLEVAVLGLTLLTRLVRLSFGLLLGRGRVRAGPRASLLPLLVLMSFRGHLGGSLVSSLIDLGTRGL
jgi:hypothetical protein